MAFRLVARPIRFNTRRYASLYFLACVDEEDNELIVLETIHHFVEVRMRAYHEVHACMLSRGRRARDGTSFCRGARAFEHSACPIMDMFVLFLVMSNPSAEVSSSLRLQNMGAYRIDFG